jgi:hypothetical protein
MFEFVDAAYLGFAPGRTTLDRFAHLGLLETYQAPVPGPIPETSTVTYLGIEREHQIARLIASRLRVTGLCGFTGSDIRIEDFPFRTQPSRGIIVSPVGRKKAIGMNGADDTRYSFQIVRVLNKLSNVDGIKCRSKWRYALRDLFNRKLIGFSGYNAVEIITTLKFSTFKIKPNWDKWGIDSSVCIVHCLVRELDASESYVSN